ncbi:MAG: NADH-quinone oxidoreductase subunit G [Neisseriales bacterium]|nr:MAG: NADH-quinone oxidoreductase subunit G [Neisseriales bacterium]
MPEIEIDGQKVTVSEGSSVLEAACAIGKYIPHFCYHKKLSIAANCRMCLVDVDKAPKPLPACATPVVDGMKVQTHSNKAIMAQRGVMEFLLINHPLDCPICDQGGECRLQDLAVGYGQSASRYTEEKRTVKGKEMGPLVAAEEMSRCIHCSRCVRFLDEIAGLQEIGIIHRTEHAEVTSFFNRPLDSEIAGNIIDLCPVGALTSKPFRYHARTWELSRRKSVAPHDGLGSNLIVQVHQHQVKRVLPFENDAINTCWLSDRDRFSYEGLNSPDRLKTPMIKKDGQWFEVDWFTAWRDIKTHFTRLIANHGKETVGVLAHPMSTCEELYLLQKLFRQLGVDNIDSRPRRSDFRSDQHQQGALWLGMPIADLSQAKAILTIGATLRSEQPLLAARLRQLAKQGCALSSIHCVKEDWRCSLVEQVVVAPSQLVYLLAEVLKALLVLTHQTSPCDLLTVLPSKQAQQIASSLFNQHAVLLLGQAAQHHPAFAQLLSLTQEIARVGGFSHGLLSEAGNSVGAELVGAIPTHGPFFSPVRSGLNNMQMLSVPQKVYFLFHLEPEADTYNSALTLSALKQAELVVACTAFKGDGLLHSADILLPICPFTETAGSFVNMGGDLQSFNQVVPPLGDSKAGWQVLQILANQFNLPAFSYTSAEAVRAEWLSLGNIDCTTLNNMLSELVVERAATPLSNQLERIGEIPMYHVDAITRRASSLQKTTPAMPPVATMHPTTAARLALAHNAIIAVSQLGETVLTTLQLDEAVPQQTLQLPGAHPKTSLLGGLFDTIIVGNH